MTMTSDTTHGDRRQITALFDSRTEADAAADRIAGLGIPQSDISIVNGAAGGATQSDEDKGFMEHLGEFFGGGSDDRATYSEGLRRGGYMLVVTTTGADRDRVIDILDDEGTVDLDAREAEWRTEGWTGYDESAATGGYAEGGAQPTTGTTGAEYSGRQPVDGTIEVAEENIRVGKRELDHGRVRVRSYVVEEPVEADVSLRDEHVSVTRTPVDREISSDAAFQDQTLTAQEHGEEAVVTKEARVTEEIRLDKEAETHTETVHDTVRHTEVEIDDERKK